MGVQVLAVVTVGACHSKALSMSTLGCSSHRLRRRCSIHVTPLKDPSKGSAPPPVTPQPSFHTACTARIAGSGTGSAAIQSLACVGSSPMELSLLRTNISCPNWMAQ